MVERSLLVMKFGGYALKDFNQFDRVVDLVLERKKRFASVVVVVSAMAKTTDYLLGLAREVHPNPPKREQDMLVSVGERISMSLLAMAFAAKGQEAVSFTGSQAGIITSSDHSDAKVVDVNPKRLISHLENGKILIVAGFQGVSRQGEITTLGRGGSDTTAVVLGVALKAEKVEFFKDVGAIFDRDPKEEAGAQSIASLTYAETREILLRSEKKVLHPRALEIAERNGLRLEVLALDEEGGSVIFGEMGRRFAPMYEEVIA